MPRGRICSVAVFPGAVGTVQMLNIFLISDIIPFSYYFYDFIYVPSNSMFQISRNLPESCTFLPMMQLQNFTDLLMSRHWKQSPLRTSRYPPLYTSTCHAHSCKDSHQNKTMSSHHYWTQRSLPIEKRIEFKLFTLTYKFLYGQAPDYSQNHKVLHTNF